MQKRIIAFVGLGILLALCLAGCRKAEEIAPSEPENTLTEEDTPIPLSPQITQLTKNFSAVAFTGDDGFDAFLAAGGASSDAEVVEFLSTTLLSDFDFLGGLFGCSTLAVKNPAGEHLFGRNFDWENCDALVVSAKPESGYASLSTVNMDFISQNSSGVINAALSIDEIRTKAALYAPLDGMNEMGLGVSVNMIADTATIDQNTEKPDITTTTAVRLLLNKAATVAEALRLLREYDLHASLGMMVHFALSDTTGQSVVVEYIDNVLVVTETPVVTNFYLAQGPKNGVGSAQSHERYAILTQALRDNKTMDTLGVRDALNSVSKDNFEEFASTEWSIVFQLDKGIAQYYHRENYEKRYTFHMQ